MHPIIVSAILPFAAQWCARSTSQILPLISLLLNVSYFIAFIRDLFTLWQVGLAASIGVGNGRPGRIEGSGPPAQAFQQIWDRCEEHDVIALRRLQLGFYGSGKSQADSLLVEFKLIVDFGQDVLTQMSMGLVHVMAEPIYS